MFHLYRNFQLMVVWSSEWSIIIFWSKSSVFRQKFRIFSSQWNFDWQQPNDQKLHFYENLLLEIVPLEVNNNKLMMFQYSGNMKQPKFQYFWAKCWSLRIIQGGILEGGLGHLKNSKNHQKLADFDQNMNEKLVVCLIRSKIAIMIAVQDI